MISEKEKHSSERSNANSEHFNAIFSGQLPLLDLRAPIEFNRGAFNQSTSLPLMTDDERAAVGTCYKEQGQQAAITLGHKLVSGQTRANREQLWLKFIAANPSGYLYCFRGGLRSRTVQGFLKELAVHYPLIEGGYKALRQFLLNRLEQLSYHSLVILGGKTGCNKTDFLASRSNSLDLEAAAGHRGSSFGAFVWPQSTQINFENKLAEQYIGGDFDPEQSILLEDEGRTIGSVHLPDALHKKMKLSPVIVVEEEFDLRLEQLFKEYVVRMLSDFIQAQGEEQGSLAFCHYFEQGVFKVRKRLGSQRYQQLTSILTKAITQLKKGDLSVFLDVLKELMVQYYDPMYDYQLDLKKERIVFRGNKQACQTYLDAL